MKMFDSSIIIFSLLAFIPYISAYISKNATKNGKVIEPRKFNDKQLMGFVSATNIEYLLRHRNLKNEALKQKAVLDAKIKDHREKLAVGMNLGMWLANQASAKNQDWQKHETNILLMINQNNFSAHICSIDRNLTSPDFHKFLIERRSRVETSKGPMKFGWLKGPGLELTVEYGVISKWKYPIEELWRISLMKVADNDWKIFKIEQDGGCPEVGRARDLITVDTQVFNLEPRIIATQLYYSLAENKELGSKLVPIMDGGDNFNATTCTTFAVFDRRFFIGYLELFLRMWEFDDNMADDEQKNFNLILNEPDRYIFRYTLPTVMYLNEPGKTEIRENWEMKVFVRYNVHGDKRWKINHIDLMCPVVRDTNEPLIIQYGKKMVYEITKGFMEKYFRVVETPFEFCNNASDANYSYTVWKHFNEWNGKQAYLTVNDVDWKSVKAHENHESFQLIFKTSTFDNDNQIRFVDWNFVIGFYHEFTYFFINQVVIGCPKDISGNLIRSWKK